MSEASIKRFVPGGPPRPRPFRLWKVVVWLVLCAGFTTVYALGASAAVVALLVVGISVGWGAAYYLWLTRWMRVFNPENHEAIQALGRGQYERAAAVFARWTERDLPTVSGIARHNLAWTRARQGRLAEALELLAENDRAPTGVKGAGLHATTAVDLALVHALVGELDVARRWLDEAARRPKVQLSHDAMTALVRAVIDCRAGRAAEAAVAIADGWSGYEAMTTGDVMRPMRIVRAFAIAAAGPRDAGLAQELLARPAYRGEYDFLGAAWPEMAAFLAAHQLGGGADAGAADQRSAIQVARANASTEPSPA